MNKSVIGFIAFVFIVSGLIFLGVREKDPYQEEREIFVKVENLRHKIVVALEERIELIDEVVYHIRLLDEFFGESDSIQVLESCERERIIAMELLEEIRIKDYFIGQEQFDIKRLEKSNAELKKSLDELRLFFKNEDEDDAGKSKEITI